MTFDAAGLRELASSPESPAPQRSLSADASAPVRPRALADSGPSVDSATFIAIASPARTGTYAQAAAPAVAASAAPDQSGDLFRHISAEKAAQYRGILDVFALAKRQYRLQLRPDEVLAEAKWPGPAPRIEEVNQLLAQLAGWGNLESQADTSRVSSLSDFSRARYLYRLSHGGEAVEAALHVFFATLARRAELQSIALEDIADRLRALLILSEARDMDVAKVHELLRDLVRLFRRFGRERPSRDTGSCRRAARLVRPRGRLETRYCPQRRQAL